MSLSIFLYNRNTYSGSQGRINVVPVRLRLPNGENSSERHLKRKNIIKLIKVPTTNRNFRS